MRLSELLVGFDYDVTRGYGDPVVSGIVYDSRKVKPGCVFICIHGDRVNSHEFVSSAIDEGARVIVYSEELTTWDNSVHYVKTPDTRKALACISAAWFGHPADKLTVVGVTGTKGKTTTTYLIRGMLEKAGYKTGLIGTVGAIIGDEVLHTPNTTPESYILQEYFAKMVEKGITHVVMEASSQGFLLHRTDGFVFDYGILTNISPDHIGPGEHRDMNDYIECKSMMFRQCRIGIVNADSDYLDEVLKGHTCEIVSYSIDSPSDLKAKDLKFEKKGRELGMEFSMEGILNTEAYVCNPGLFSVYNALSACALGAAMHIGLDHILAALAETHVKGRIEPVEVSDDFHVLIDYAHNAMALENLLVTLKEYKPKRLVCLFGCGGNRSSLRRFEMGEVSGKYADLTVITSDNPRFEEPAAIISDIKKGIMKTSGRHMDIENRVEAIDWVLRNAEKGDIIVLAGKGHEDYQEIKGKRYPMDERVIVKELMEKIKA
ncbi:MAG: UDP-N-acetylmuramoyl-L-alanyl-D-glutamate--2,6-diaminopimelate ligase [Lachnospiraceae bacterium]|nr:UDP-N-acetylmuramoyl-L-alanyl-D-glutamate--2,6-diaminopimelate ligase [Lachnospiraceae bacterium]